MKEIYFFNFHGKLRFPIFPTFRLYSEYWEGRILETVKAFIGSRRHPETADYIGKAVLLTSTKVKYGLIPAEFVEYDTDLSFLDAEDLFGQMHKTKWSGVNTDMSMILLYWLERNKAFYKHLKIWQEQQKAIKKDRKVRTRPKRSTKR